MLSTSIPAAGTSLTSIGWGSSQLTSVGGTNDLLKYAPLQVGTLGVAPCPAGCYDQVPCTIQCEIGDQLALGGYPSACAGDYGAPQMLAGTVTQVSIVSFGPADCGNKKYGYSTLVSPVNSYIQAILASGTSTSPPPSGSLPPASPVPSSPMPVVSPLPIPGQNCTLNTNSGLIVTVSAAASACSMTVSYASAMAIADVSGSSRYCHFYRCSRSNTNTITIKIKLIVVNPRTVAKSNIINSFKTGQYYARFKFRLPYGYQNYQLKTGSACLFPGSACSY